MASAGAAVERRLSSRRTVMEEMEKEERTVLAYMRRGSGGYAAREFRPSADVPPRSQGLLHARRLLRSARHYRARKCGSVK